MGKHRAKGWIVSQPGSKSVIYPSKGQAKRVSSQLSGSKVTKVSGLVSRLADLLRR